MVDMGTKRLKMGVGERLQILNGYSFEKAGKEEKVSFLPESGGMVTQRIANDIRKKVGLSQEEMKKYALIEEPIGDGRSRLKWDTAAPPAEIVFTEAEYKMLRDAVGRIDQEGKIAPHSLDTCELILGNRTDEEKEPDQS